MAFAHRKLTTVALVASISALVFGAGLAAAQEKDMREFSPGTGRREKRALRAEDVAKAQTNASQRPEPAWKSGIIDSGLAPFPAAMYQFENQWHEIVNGEHLKVYAGSLGKGSSQGVVVVQRISLDNRAQAPQEIRAPAGAGSLRITSARENALTLRSSSGSEFTFNVAKTTLTPR